MSTNVPIASITLSAATPSVTFSGIPQTYTDLVLVVNSSNTPNNAGGIRFNDDSGNNYSLTRLYGTGSSASSDRASNQNHIYLTIGSTTSNQLTTTQISNYANSSVYKTVLMRIYAAPANFVAAQTALWRNTNAITSITFFNPTGGTTFNSGSTFNLYGINAANSAQAKATGGDSIYRDSSYWYHVFNKSGTFTPAQNLSNVDYLVVAGGGGGGRNIGGGGGAGGLRSSISPTGGGGSTESAFSLSSSTSYIVTIGAGGTGQIVVGTPSTNGSNSSISGTGITTITSIGGGSGGGYNGSQYTAGGNGGSGGGGGYAAAGGSRTSNQGYDGGSGGAYPSGGGGAGEAGNTDGNREGGDGVSNSITGTSVSYAGGGGGGGYFAAGGGGGIGGGGAGGSHSGDVAGVTGIAGTTNTGGGGGGGTANDGNGGAGGSGIIIVRYPV